MPDVIIPIVRQRDKATGLHTVGVKIGESLVDVLVTIGFATSKREARYFITHGAVRLGKEKV